jgi:hypothetical protein
MSMPIGDNTRTKAYKQHCPRVTRHTVDVIVHLVCYKNAGFDSFKV